MTKTNGSLKPSDAAEHFARAAGFDSVSDLLEQAGESYKRFLGAALGVELPSMFPLARGNVRNFTDICLDFMHDRSRQGVTTLDADARRIVGHD